MTPTTATENPLPKDPVLFKCDGTFQTVLPKDGEHFSLEEAQALVGGFVEVIWITEQHIMLLHEEGKLIGLPVNRRATALARPVLGEGDFIVGQALVCEGRFFK